MNDEHIVSVAQLQEFLKGVDGAVTFSSETKGNKNKPNDDKVGKNFQSKREEIKKAE